jgi:hypothetical protein
MTKKVKAASPKAVPAADVKLLQAHRHFFDLPS